MKLLFRILPLVLLPLSLALGGCNNSTCADNHSALPLMGFYNSATGSSLQLDSIDFGGVNAPLDSLLVHSGQRVSQIYLPFRNEQSSCTFFIHYDYKLQGLDHPALNDTITFHYSSNPFFASNECGAMYEYHISQVSFTRHLIDNLIITDSVITNIERERIQVFFRVAEPESPDEELMERRFSTADSATLYRRLQTAAPVEGSEL